MILILAPERDVHARRVAQEIELLDGEVEIIDWRDAGTGMVASLHYTARRLRRSIRSSEGAQALDLASVGAVWTRRVGPATVTPSIIDQDQRWFAGAEWRDLLYGLVDGPAAVSPLAFQRGATKPTQLRHAPAAGLTIPETMITSDPAEAAEFIDALDGRVVHKALNSPNDRLLETVRWDERHRVELERLRLAPTIFQELIEGPRDLRITMIGTECYAAAIEGGPAPRHVDSRLDLEKPVTPFEVPAEIQESLVKLMIALGLQYATIDVKQAWDGTLYFLELNPQGQFLYVEILTGLPIAAALAKYLLSYEI